MTQAAPAFWAKYRGPIDPQRDDLSTSYTYDASFFYANSAPAYQLSFTVLGPPQLTKERFIELNWTIPPGVIGISIDFGGNFYYSSNAAEQGTRDEGRFNVLGSGVLNQ